MGPLSWEDPRGSGPAPGGQRQASWQRGCSGGWRSQWSAQARLQGPGTLSPLCTVCTPTWVSRKACTVRSSTSRFSMRPRKRPMSRSLMWVLTPRRSSMTVLSHWALVKRCWISGVRGDKPSWIRCPRGATLSSPQGPAAQARLKDAKGLAQVQTHRVPDDRGQKAREVQGKRDKGTSTRPVLCSRLRITQLPPNPASPQLRMCFSHRNTHTCSTGESGGNSQQHQGCDPLSQLACLCLVNWLL